jgi:hypothetical protein
MWLLLAGSWGLPNQWPLMAALLAPTFIISLINIFFWSRTSLTNQKQVSVQMMPWLVPAWKEGMGAGAHWS